MAIIGNKIKLSYGSYNLDISEQQMVGMDGYSKKCTSKPRLDRSSYGSVRYKQANYDFPLHEFNFNFVLPKSDADALLTQIEASIVAYKNNSSRNATNWVINDDRIATLCIPGLPRILSTGVIFTATEPEFKFLTHKLLFKTAYQEEFSSTLTNLIASAVEVL